MYSVPQWGQKNDAKIIAPVCTALTSVASSCQYRQLQTESWRRCRAGGEPSAQRSIGRKTGACRVITAEHAAEIFVKTADSIERLLGILQEEEPKATTILRQYAQSVREMATTPAAH